MDDGSRPALSDTQWEVMQAIWTLKEATVTEVWENLARQRDVARNTVLTQMDRLVKKGWLTRRDASRGHLYRAAESAERTRQEHLRRWLRTAFDGAADQLVLSLLEAETLTDEQVQRIRKIISQARRKQQ